MNILYWFKSIRTPILDDFFSTVTYLGHELIPIALICILYWCINKSLAYKIGFSFFASGLTTQALKITFRIDRPWILDPEFKPVGDAIDEATSYSFPSGHTQSATSVYGSLAMGIKKNWVRIICVIAFVVVGISRMYLGVHTLKDVAVAMVLTLVITYLVFRFVDPEDRKMDIWISVVMLFVSAAVIIYALCLSDKITADSVEDCVKSGAAGLAFAIGYFIERRYIDFDVKAPLWGQIIKTAVGLGIALGLKSALKFIVGDTVIGDGIRYFVLVMFIIVVYPLIIKTISKRKG